LLYYFQNYVLDTERRELRHGADAVSLQPQVFDLLEYLIRNRERVVSKDNLIAGIWGGRIVSESALITRINAARGAIGDSGAEQRSIKTLPRKGVRFVAKVREQQASDVNARAMVQPGLPLPDLPSLAVLPFQNMSGDPGEDYFADGVADEIITALSRFLQLFVIARNSSFTYKGRSVDVKQVGRELGVRYVLEGSVRKAVSRLRITAQLIDAIRGTHLWADRIDGTFGDIFDLQDRVTENVVGALAPKIEQAEIERTKHKPTDSLDAYDCYLRAMMYFHRWTTDSINDALRLFYRAIELDPAFASPQCQSPPRAPATH
jgi:TolB-like protein